MSGAFNTCVLENSNSELKICNWCHDFWKEVSNPVVCSPCPIFVHAPLKALTSCPLELDPDSLLIYIYWILFIFSMDKQRICVLWGSFQHYTWRSISKLWVIESKSCRNDQSWASTKLWPLNYFTGDTSRRGSSVFGPAHFEIRRQWARIHFSGWLHSRSSSPGENHPLTGFDVPILS